MNNKKILITGGTGFIGSHLTELCVKGDIRFMLLTVIIRNII